MPTTRIYQCIVTLMLVSKPRDSRGVWGLPRGCRQPWPTEWRWPTVGFPKKHQQPPSLWTIVRERESSQPSARTVRPAAPAVLLSAPWASTPASAGLSQLQVLPTGTDLPLLSGERCRGSGWKAVLRPVVSPASHSSQILPPQWPTPASCRSSCHPPIRPTFCRRLLGSPERMTLPGTTGPRGTVLSCPPLRLVS